MFARGREAQCARSFFEHRHLRRSLLSALIAFACVGASISTAVAGATQPYANYQSAVSGDSPAAQFRFDDLSGSTTINDSAGAYTALNSAVALGGEGPFGGSKSGAFNSEAFATLPGDPLSSAGEFTAELWIDWGGGTTYKEPIFDFGSSATNFISLTPSSALTKHPMLLEIHPTSGGVAQLTATKLGSKSWEYVVATETSAGVLKLYVNGTVVGETTSTLSPASISSATIDYLGKSLLSGDPELKGSLSNVAFYTHALSAEAIQHHYNEAEFPVNTTLPSIAGSAREGSNLRAKEGNWSGLSPISYGLHWQRLEGGVWVNIAGANTTAYTPTAKDVGHNLRFAVSASNAAGPGEEAFSLETVPVLGFAPKNEAPPTISGTMQEGQTLTASSGSWTGTEPIAFAYQWELCGGKKCTPISGATSSTFTVPTGFGATYRVTVTATNSLGSASASSEVTGLALPGPPVEVAGPTISGEALEGHGLTANPGTWNGTPIISYEYQWRHCNGGTCTNIVGATLATYMVAREDTGDTLEVTVTAKNSIGEVSATSAQTETVPSTLPVNTAPPTISGEALEGNTLTASPGTWSGAPSYSYQWSRCNESGCTAIPGASANTYLLTRADFKQTLEVTVTATNSAGSAHATSAETNEAQSDGTAVAWGENYHGQAGQIYRNGFETNPVGVQGVEHISEVALSGGGSVDLALLANGTVDSWGGNKYGQLGNEKNLANWEEGLSHTQVGEYVGPHEAGVPLKNVKQIAAGGEHGLALLKDGTVKGWGNNLYGQLGDGHHGFETQTSDYERLAKTIEWPEINKEEEVRFKKEERKRPVYTPAGKLTHILSIAVGGGSEFALTSEHTALAWGSNTEGQLGLGLSEPGPEACETETAKAPFSEPCSSTPRPVMWNNPWTGTREAIKEVASIVPGEFATYLLLKDGHVVSFGANHNGELGTGAITVHGTELPAKLVRVNDGKPTEETGEALSNVVEVAAGYTTAFARAEHEGKEEIYGWGSDVEGALTLPVNEAPVVNCKPEHTPAKEKELEEKIAEEKAAIKALEEEIKAKEAKGESVTTLEKELKTAKKKLKELPVPLSCVPKASRLPALEALHPEELAAGNDYGIALSARHVYTWGKNERGELGNGLPPKNSTNPETGANIREAGYPTPTRVGGFGNAVEVKAAVAHPLVLLEAGASAPPPLVSVTPAHLELTLEWQHETSLGETLTGEKVNYKVADRTGEPPTSEGADPENDEGPPVDFEEPTINGLEEGEAPIVGEKLKAIRGTWGGAHPLKFTFEWERCNHEGHCEASPTEHCTKGHTPECELVYGPSEFPGHTVLESDVGYTLRAKVIVKNPEGEASATTQPSETVELEPGESEKTTQRKIEPGEDPVHIFETVEKFSPDKEEREHGVKVEEVRTPLTAVPYELKFRASEAKGSEKFTPPETRTMIATPLP
jgi:alpha-tubulin suppressor-like RCC1 family protein